MSEGHEHDDDAADAHDDHGFDGEPATELGPDEPRTPGWLPAVGAAVFVAAAVFVLVWQRGPEGAPSAPAELAAAAPQIMATAMQPQRPATPPQRPAMPRPAQPAPTAVGSAANALQNMPPEQLRDLQRRVQEAAVAKEKKAKEANGAQK